jgi:hypothetical protein
MKITKKSHPEFVEVMKKAYLEYKGRKFYFIIEDGEIDCTSYWSEGSRVLYKFVRFDGKMFSLPESHPFIQEHNENRKIKLCPGLACITHSFVQGYDCGLILMLCSENKDVKSIDCK